MEETNIEIAERCYPAGTKYVNASTVKGVEITEDAPRTVDEATIYGSEGRGCVMFKSKWAKILPPTAMLGMRVQRGPDWGHDKQGDGTCGVIMGICGRDLPINVKWDNGYTNAYDWGNKGVIPVTPEFDTVKKSADYLECIKSTDSSGTKSQFIKGNRYLINRKNKSRYFILNEGGSECDMPLNGYIWGFKEVKEKKYEYALTYERQIDNPFAIGEALVGDMFNDYVVGDIFKIKEGNCIYYALDKEGNERAFYKSEIKILKKIGVNSQPVSGSKVIKNKYDDKGNKIDGGETGKSDKRGVRESTTKKELRRLQSGVEKSYRRQRIGIKEVSGSRRR